ncbi:hypothetical protein HDU98_001882 [Podochytrium sp. JEL0797]|nr:hypothetical protein HDU98_001882 [Podochytrium sp. JEL0797]
MSAKPRQPRAIIQFASICHANAATASAIITIDGDRVLEVATVLPAPPGVVPTKPQTEYGALLLGLTEASELKLECVEMQSVSKLVMKQMTGETKAKTKTIQRLHLQAKRILQKSSFRDSCTFTHVSKPANQSAHNLANECLYSLRKETRRSFPRMGAADAVIVCDPKLVEPSPPTPRTASLDDKSCALNITAIDTAFQVASDTSTPSVDTLAYLDSNVMDADEHQMMPEESSDNGIAANHSPQQNHQNDDPLARNDSFVPLNPEFEAALANLSPEQKQLMELIGAGKNCFITGYWVLCVCLCLEAGLLFPVLILI